MTGRERWLAMIALAVAGQFVFAACGGNGAAVSKDATVGPWDAGAGADGVSCAALPCLAGATGLIASCAPGGTCTQQLTVSGGTSTMAKCFSNGVKILLTGMNLASGGTSTVMTVRKDGAACYAWTATEDSAAVGSMVYVDGAGAELVTEMVAGATATVTCPGGAAIVQDQDHSCDAALYALGGLYPFSNATTCTSGTCGF